MPKKVSSVSRKKRPKSIYKRMWETRRKNAALKVLVNMPPPKLTDLNVKAIAQEMERLSPTTGSTIQSLSEISGGDALLRMSMMHRDDQLCCFVGDMSALRSQRAPLHAPVMLTRTQAEAIEEFLIDHGYSMWGKASVKAA